MHCIATERYKVFTVAIKQLLELLPTASAGNAIAYVRPSVRPFVFTLSSEPTDR